MNTKNREPDNRAFSTTTLFFLVLLLCILTYEIRTIGISARGNFGWDEVAMWIQSLSDFRAPFMAPLPPLAAGAFVYLFNDSSFETFHSIHVLLSIPSIVFTYLAAREILSRKASIACATIVSLSPLGFYYAQEARPYALGQSVSALLLLATVRSLKRPSLATYVLLLGASTLCMLTHLMFLNVLIGVALGLCFWGFHSRTRKTSIPLNSLLLNLASISAGTLLGSLWIFVRPISESVSSGIYAKGFLHFVRSTLRALMTSDAYFASTTAIEMKDFLAVFVAGLALAGIANIFLNKDQSVGLCLFFALFISLFGLYFTLGEKAYWPWFRYLSHLLSWYALAVAAGIDLVSERRSLSSLSTSILPFAFICLLLAPGLSHCLERSLRVRNPIVKLAHAELKEIAPDIDAVLLPRATWGYGEESRRNMTFYYKFRDTKIPTFYINANTVNAIDLADSKWKLDTIPQIGAQLSSMLEPGRYALFPYGHVQEDGPHGKNKPKCSLLLDLGIARAATRMQHPKSEFIEICQVS